MMGWMVWLAASLALLATGAYLVLRGWTRVVRVYVTSCIVLALMSVFNLGALFGPAGAPVTKWLLFALLPATVILAIWTTKRDRDRVMGPAGDREAIATAAVLYGASSTHLEGSAGDAGGGFES